jgi:hypothetical protein
MDPRWNTFAKVCEQEFGSCTFQAELVRECGGNEDIAWATYFHLRSDAINWLHRSVPALSGRTPASLMAEDREDEVRHCLWSMPC